ncbi:uncharacterized protein [Procambarus clarkii]|uniref:uncharacterized protein n=1 Tax=Procambarus clarkii TaxID=6728 RepID=UPI0037427DFC
MQSDEGVAGQGGEGVAGQGGEGVAGQGSEGVAGQGGEGVAGQGGEGVAGQGGEGVAGWGGEGVAGQGGEGVAGWGGKGVAGQGGKGVTRAAYAPTILRLTIEKKMSSIAVAEATHIFTDGSVDTEYESAGAALCTASEQAYWRLEGAVLSTQTELFAIQQALAYVIAQNTQNAIIHRDSKDALQILGK